MSFYLGHKIRFRLLLLLCGGGGGGGGGSTLHTQ
jgi:hypothetical protein